MYHVIFVYCSLIDDVLCTSQNKILFCSVKLDLDALSNKRMREIETTTIRRLYISSSKRTLARSGGWGT